MKLALINQRKLVAIRPEIDLDQLNNLLTCMVNYSNFEQLRRNEPALFKVFWTKFKHWRRVDIFDEIQAQYYGYPSAKEFYNMAQTILSVIKVELMKMRR